MRLTSGLYVPGPLAPLYIPSRRDRPDLWRIPPIVPWRCAFPTVGGTNTTNGDPAVTQATVNLPTGIANGDLLLMIHRAMSATTSLTPSVGTGTFTSIFESIADASNDRTQMWYHVCDGTEGATGTVDHNNSISTKFANLTILIDAGTWDTGNNPVASAGAIGTNDLPDPDNLAATVTRDNLWIACFGCDGEITITTYPTNYGDNNITADSLIAGAAATNGRIGLATRNLNAASENPGSYDLSAAPNAGWTAWTAVVHGLAGAPGRAIRRKPMQQWPAERYAW